MSRALLLPRRRRSLRLPPRRQTTSDPLTWEARETTRPPSWRSASSTTSTCDPGISTSSRSWGLAMAAQLAKSGTSRQTRSWPARFVSPNPWTHRLLFLDLQHTDRVDAQVIHVEAKREMRKPIVRELQIMHGCHSDYIVTFYGAFLNDNNDVIMCMEYMDVG